MKVAIVGAGKLGYTLAEALVGGDNEVTIIDIDSERLDALSAKFDIMTVCGDGKRVETLQEIEIEDYDFLVSVTAGDELNIVIASFARALGCKNVIARVREPEHVSQRDFIREKMNIDFIVNPDLSTATEIYKYLVEKYSFTNGIFDTGRIAVVEFLADNMPALVGKELKDVACLPDNTLIIAISRNGKIIVPSGSTVIVADDNIYLIGENSLLRRLNDTFTEKAKVNAVKKVMLAGGGKTGFFLAKFLSDFDVKVKIVEANLDRCHYLSERLPDNVKILHGDATDNDVLLEENLEDMDAFVAITGYDEENLLLAIFASNHQIEDVVAKVSRKGYSDLAEQLGVSMALNPLDMTASAILRYIQGTKRAISSTLIQGQAEFIEIQCDETMEIVDKPLFRLNLPQGVLIAAIGRGDQVIIPNGNTRIQAGDKVIIFAMLSQVAKLENILKPNKPSFTDNIKKFFSPGK